ncbi:GTP cyclohydrolase 1 [Meristemomyces frigidus]|nr:GTP cyclohydrolase 1 [Meristemomyces frigidus]
MASITGSSTTGTDSASKRKPKDKKRGKEKPAEDVSTSPAPLTDGRAIRKRRTRPGNAARNPRDEPAAKTPSPVIDFDGLSRPSSGTRSRIDEGPEQAEKRLEMMCGAVRTLLECVGEDPDREGLLGTPSRYAKALLFLTKGYQDHVKDVVNNALFNEGHNEMVIVKDIDIYSLCEHHLVPFTGKMHIGYIPSNTVIGLSKLPRIAEMFSRRLQIQERLTKEVAHAIMEIFNPQGVAVVMESCHLCMVIRGVQKTGTTTITSCVLGCFERQSKTRNEFLSFVGVNRT